MPLEDGNRVGLVLGHQAAIPGDVRHEDGGESALDMYLVHIAPRSKTDFSSAEMLKHIFLGVHAWPHAGRMALVKTRHQYLATKPTGT